MRFFSLAYAHEIAAETTVFSPIPRGNCWHDRPDCPGLSASSRVFPLGDRALAERLLLKPCRKCVRVSDA